MVLLATTGPASQGSAPSPKKRGKKRNRFKQEGSNKMATDGGGSPSTSSNLPPKHPGNSTASSTATHTASTGWLGGSSIFRENSSRSPSFSGTDFAYINEKPVDDVSISCFYEPRTLTLLCLAIGALVYVAFNRCVPSQKLFSQLGKPLSSEENSTEIVDTATAYVNSVVDWVLGTYCAVIKHLLIDTCVDFLIFYRDESNIQDNLSAGFKCVVFFFLIISVLAFPNGPFTRPVNKTFFFLLEQIL